MNNSTYTYSESMASDTMMAAFYGPFLLFWLIVAVVMVVATWKLFTKAGRPGWASIVPIYNTIVMLDIIGRPWWLIILLLIPFVNIYVSIIMALDVAKAYGKDVVFGILNMFVPYVSYPILAFDRSVKYVGQVAKGKTLEP